MPQRFSPLDAPHSIRRDLAHAARSLAKDRAFTLICVISLGILAAVLIRTMEDVMGTPLTLGPTPLGVMEPLIYVLASTIALAAALLAGLPAARRATTVQPMVAIRSE
jgi:ABC-type antimicrobial peptide transport system permease subunit